MHYFAGRGRGAGRGARGAGAGAGWARDSAGRVRSGVAWDRGEAVFSDTRGRYAGVGRAATTLSTKAVCADPRPYSRSNER